MPVLRVDEERLHDDLVELGEIGWDPVHGLARTTFSSAHSAARGWFVERARTAGLVTPGGLGGESLGNSPRTIGRPDTAVGLAS